MVLLIGFGLDKEVADKLRDNLMPSVQEKLPGFPETEFERPFYGLSIAEETIETLRSGGARDKSQEFAAQMLKTTAANLKLERSYAIIYTKLKKPVIQKPEKTNQDKVIVILALGELNKSNGLPIFQDSPTVDLQSGQLLGVPLSKTQTFAGCGGGLGYIWVWGA